MAGEKAFPNDMVAANDGERRDEGGGEDVKECASN